jgi:hypothetical protein
MMRLVGYDMSREAAARSTQQAGIGPEDLDVVELHDCFAHNELITYEALGLCPEGGADKFIRDGDNTYGGKVVTNPSGGLLSKGHPLGATGLAQCFELTHQLRGSAGARQVEGARTSRCSTTWAWAAPASSPCTRRVMSRMDYLSLDDAGTGRLPRRRAPLRRHEIAPHQRALAQAAARRPRAVAARPARWACCWPTSPKNTAARAAASPTSAWCSRSWLRRRHGLRPARARHRRPLPAEPGHRGAEARYLPKLASGEMIAAIAMSEPGAGSDLKGIRTTAVAGPTAIA